MIASSSFLAPLGEALPGFSVREEICNAGTHGLFALLAIAKLIQFHNRDASTSPDEGIGPVGKYVMLVSFVVLYFNSFMYHALTHVPTKTVFRFLDHLSILIFMIGSSFPFITHAFSVWQSVASYALIGGSALVGGYFKFVYWTEFEPYSVYFEVGFGCLITAITVPALLQTSRKTLTWFLLGALVYLMGVPFFMSKSLTYHTIFHLFVMGGSFCHFWAVFH
jgi:hemolysin III